MSASSLSLRLADRPLARALHRRHAQHDPVPVYETTVVELHDDRLLTLVLALAPMVFAFFYLAFTVRMLFH